MAAAPANQRAACWHPASSSLQKEPSGRRRRPWWWTGVGRATSRRRCHHPPPPPPLLYSPSPQPLPARVNKTSRCPVSITSLAATPGPASSRKPRSWFLMIKSLFPRSPTHDAAVTKERPCICVLPMWSVATRA